MSSPSHWIASEREWAGWRSRGKIAGALRSFQLEQNMNNGGMHATRFSSWAGDCPVGQTSGSTCCRTRKGGRSRCCRAARRAGWWAIRCGCDGFCPGRPARKRGSGAVGQRSDGAARKRTVVWACAAQLRHTCAGLAGRGQPSARRALDDGGSGGMCRPVCRRGRDPWRARSAEFHRDQASGLAGRGVKGADLADPVGRSWRAVGGARTLAAALAALCPASVEPPGPGRPPVGGRSVSRAGPGTGGVGGVI